MSVEVHGEGVGSLLGEPEIVRTVVEALREGGRADLHVGVVLVDDAALRELHERFLGDPSTTDVMAFDLGEEGEGPAAEIYVSIERARAEARRRGLPPARELALYLVHGALHLCGLDDHEEEERVRMRAAEARVLERLGYAPDNSPHECEPDP